MGCIRRRGGGGCESAYGEFLPLRPKEEMTIGVRIGMIERLARHFLNQQYCRSNPTGFVVDRVRQVFVVIVFRLSVCLYFTSKTYPAKTST